MKKHFLSSALVLALTAAASQADAQTNELVVTNVSTIDLSPITTQFPPPVLQDPSFACLHADKTPCSAADLQSPVMKQIVILSAGFTEAERDAFFSELPVIVDGMTGPAAGSAWSAQKQKQLLFVGIFTGGGELGSTTSSFGASVMVHPIRGYGLSLSNDAVYAKIDALKASSYPTLRPFAAGVLMNTYQNPVKTATLPPSFARRPYGIAKLSRHDVEASPYIATHELAHAGLNFVDEYTEQGLESTNVKSLDALAPLVGLDGTWGGWTAGISNFFGVYSIQISEVLANNGNVNVSTSPFPSTVYTPGYSSPAFQYEGGLFFGRGTWHVPGANLMNDNNVVRGTDDGFAYAHSPEQQRIIDLAFGDRSKVRPNDRLQNAGPVSGWPLAFGSTTHVMLHDGDANNQFHPTQSYAVQVGWYERHWKTCWAVFIPYPCYDNVWTTAQKTVGRSPRNIQLKMSAAYSLASLAQNLLCDLGIQEINSSGGKFNLCRQPLDTITDAFNPTVTLPAPYLDVEVPASQWMTTYYWRFSTNNGAVQSGFTGWSSFFRSL